MAHCLVKTELLRVESQGGIAVICDFFGRTILERRRCLVRQDRVQRQGRESRSFEMKPVTWSNWSQSFLEYSADSRKPTLQFVAGEE